MNIYYLELYFFKNKALVNTLMESPNFDLYANNTELIKISGKNIEDIKYDLTSKISNIAYIHILDVYKINY